MFPEAKPRETGIEVEDNKTHCFPRDQSLSVLLYLPTQNYKKTAKKSFALLRLAYKFATVSRSTTRSRASRKFTLLFS